jgi:hypothetical protein
VSEPEPMTAAPSPKPYTITELRQMCEHDPRLRATMAEVNAEVTRQTRVRDNLIAGMVIQAGGKYSVDAKAMEMASGAHQCNVDGDENGNIHFRVAVDVTKKTIDVEAKEIPVGDQDQKPVTQ